ncbi:MAG: SGNH/GDSL hydrolase family protein, partial [Erysipelotrichia bacterium]|nr:SGNH/GDSL hydrolase family protein [Erysipelotrichia bacterium]
MNAPFSANNAIRVVGKLLVSCIVLPCIFLILLEAAARSTDIGYPSTLFIEETTADGAWLRPNYRVGYRFFPAKLARKPLPEIMPAIKPADRLRIFVLGESAARGEQLADFSFSRMLEVALQNGSLQKKVEVINTGIPAINSWVLRDFAREIMNYQPDLIVVYAGHNEFIGPYGPGSVFGLAGNRNAALIGIWASSLRLIQALKPDKLPAELARGWQGLEMFMKNSIKPDSKAISDCLENWRKNLDDIFATAAAAKIPVIWCRVPVNHKDCPPFISDESGFLPETTALIEQIKKYSENNEHQKVLQNIDKIRTKVKNHALADYLEGSARLALGDPKSAGQCFKNALNNDCFRVRTTDIFNDAAAEAAKRHKVHIADIEAAFVGNSGNGIIGAELIYDHVHLTLKGHHIAAAGIFSSIKNIQPALMQSMPDKFPDLEEIKKYTGFTDQDEIDNLTHIISSIQEPPFTSQFMHNSRLKQLNMQIETLKKSRKDFATNIALISDAAIRQPFNWAIQNRLAMMLRHD